jgi:endonuclease I
MGCISKCYFQPMESEYLGLIARAILYFYDKYSDFVKSEKLVDKYMSPEILQIMHTWDVTYEPTEYEINRNFQIFKLQGTSNPFFRTAMARVHRRTAMKNLLRYAPEQVFFSIVKP